MLEAGMTSKYVANARGVCLRTITYWKKKSRNGESLSDRPHSGRPKALTCVAKNVITKSVSKRFHSTQKLAAKLTGAGHKCSQSTVNHFMKNDLGLKAYKLAKIRKLMKNQRKARLQFALARKNWTFDDWKNVCFSDESTFQLFPPTNHQTDRVWASNSSQVPTESTVKHPPNLMVWGMISAQGLSVLHTMPPKTSVNTDYYVRNILQGLCLDAFQRKRAKGHVLKRRMAENMSKAIYQQDGAPCHHSVAAQQWCRENLQNFWEKGIWPPNSPDLSPIENLWAIMKSELLNLPDMTEIKQLEKKPENDMVKDSPRNAEKFVHWDARKD